MEKKSESKIILVENEPLLGGDPHAKCKKILGIIIFLTMLVSVTGLVIFFVIGQLGGFNKPGIFFSKA